MDDMKNSYYAKEPFKSRAQKEGLENVIFESKPCEGACIISLDWFLDSIDFERLSKYIFCMILIKIKIGSITIKEMNVLGKIKSKKPKPEETQRETHKIETQ